MVVLAGTVAADPVLRRMPSGDEVTGSRGLSRLAMGWHRAPGSEQLGS